MVLQHEHKHGHGQEQRHRGVRAPTPDFCRAGCGHDHSAVRNIGIAFAINFVFALIELVGGFLTGSVAVASNAIHDLADSLSLGLAFFFEKIASGARITNSVLAIGVCRCYRH